MASGMAKRFGSNKLMADFYGEAMICRILKSTRGLFTGLVVVTRHKEVEALCKEEGIRVILHDCPNRNDTVRLGMEALGPDLDAYMFCQSDQPLLTRASIEKLLEAGQGEGDKIWRLSYGNQVGAPVLFPSWTYEALLHLPEKKGGGYLIKAYPDQVGLVEAESEYELKDVDRPEDLDMLREEIIRREENLAE